MATLSRTVLPVTAYAPPSGITSLVGRRHTTSRVLLSGLVRVTARARKSTRAPVSMVPSVASALLPSGTTKVRPRMRRPFQTPPVLQLMQ